ncbi:MAG: hypothetical protein N2444_03965, partial [Methylocystis sp.]|nr:hypothetical protein [Methylocystis sp.]
FYSTWDWTIRDAVLSDIVANKYPIFYRYLGGDFVLRAPLAMYMLPASVGWALGLSAAHFALLAQNGFLFSIIFYLAAILAEGPKSRFIGLLVLFGPLDVIPNLIESYLFVYRVKGEFILEPHFMNWNALLQFWSHLPQLFWAPNHAIAGWAAATLVLLHIRREIDIVLLAISSIILLFWSPLGLIGAAPFLLWRACGSLSLSLLSRRTLIALIAAICFAPLFVYLTLDSGALSREWLIGRPDFLFWYAAAMIFALPQAWILLASRDFIAPSLKPATYVAIALLVVMPFYRFGVTQLNNDMTMRCTLAPMFILAFAFCQAAPTLAEGHGLKSLTTAAVIMLSSMTGLMEIRRAIVDPPYKINDCNLVTVLGKVFGGYSAANYLAPVDKAPAWLLRTDGPRLAGESRQCWPGHPFGQQLNDVSDPGPLRGDK